MASMDLDEQRKTEDSDSDEELGVSKSQDPRSASMRRISVATEYVNLFLQYAF